VSEAISRQFIVHGRVQGVFFRASTQREAQRLGLDGWACNLHDGTVLVIARGPRDGVDALQQWLQQGPPLAHVSRVEAADYDQTVPAGFSTG